MRRVLSVVLLGTMLVCLGCRLTGDYPENVSTPPVATLTLDGNIGLAEVETGNLGSIRNSVASGTSSDFSGFLAILKSSAGTEISRSNVSIRSFTFREISPASNLLVEILHSDVGKRKLRLLHVLDEFSADAAITVDEESTSVGLIVEKAIAEGKSVTASAVKSQFSNQLGAVKTALASALKQAIASGSSIEQDATLVSKLSDASKAISESQPATTPTTPTATSTTTAPPTTPTATSTTTTPTTPTATSTTTTPPTTPTATSTTTTPTTPTATSTPTTSAPNIVVKGNAVEIANGDSTPGSSDYTDFGTVTANSESAARTFTIVNTGNAALSLTASPLVAVSGTNSSEFTVTVQPASSVSAGGNTTFTVTFAPAGSGTRTATLSIANSDSQKNPYTFTIQGTGTTTPTTSAPSMVVKGNTVEIANGDSTPGSSDYTDFGTATASSDSVARSFTIENTGNAALSLTASPLVAVSGTNASEFTVTTQPASSVSAGGNTTFTVTFAPAGSGTRTASLSIANSDSQKNPYSFTIRGTGQAAPAGASSVTFDSPINAGAYDVGAIWVVVSGVTDKTPFADLATNIKNANNADVKFARASNLDAIFNEGMVLSVASMDPEAAGTFSSLSFFDSNNPSNPITIPAGATITVYADNVNNPLGSKTL